MTDAAVPPDFDPKALAEFLDGEHREARQRVKQSMVQYAKLMREAIGLPTDEYRRQVREVVRATAGSGTTGLGFPQEYGGGGDIGASIASFETLAFSDLSVLVKMGVQFGLFGGAILHLGNEQHHQSYLRDYRVLRLLELLLLGMQAAHALSRLGHKLR